MIKQNQKILNIFNLLSDVLITIMAYFAALVIRFVLLDGVWTLNMLGARYMLLLGFFCVEQVVLFQWLRVYGIMRYHSFLVQLAAVFFAYAVCLVSMVAWLYLSRINDFSRLMLGIFYLLGSGLIGVKHMVIRLAARYARAHGYNLKHIILVGTGELAHRYAENIRKNPALGIHIDGYLGRPGMAAIGECLGGYESIGDILSRRHDVDELVIALTLNEEGLVHRIIDTAFSEGVRTKVIPVYNDYIPANPTIDVIGSTRLIDLNSSPLDNVFNAWVKRAMDIIVSAVGIVITSPVMLAVAVGVKLSGPGPVFFVQERMGCGKKNFKMLKFRSMAVNNAENTAWSTDSDPRKTAFGSIIRKMSLDELPQLFNVLAGQMSLVGPRPEIPYHISHFKKEIPRYMVRQQVRPGITGWAQINGLRGDTDISSRIDYDLWYINNWTLSLDIKILWKTVAGGFINRETVNVGKKSEK